ncbi:MAG: TetR/AcrR family transcriptional regulator [Microscillaceae bacterium]|nr:TetR/AcrR family transcriptional regulator [Microscillaceae bacterium]
MGRKAIERERKKDAYKTEKWIKQLLPYFQKNGLKGITMDLVAKELNRSKTTVYEYFSSKEELLDLMVAYKLKQIGGFEKILNDASQSYIDRCYAVLKYQADHISDISNLFLADLREFHPDLWVRVQDFLEDAAQKIEAFYQAGIYHQEFNPIHTAILTLNDHFFFRVLTDPDFLSRHGLTLQEAFDQYLKLKFFGLIRTAAHHDTPK